MTYRRNAGPEFIGAQDQQVIALAIAEAVDQYSGPADRG